MPVGILVLSLKRPIAIAEQNVTELLPTPAEMMSSLPSPLKSPAMGEISPASSRIIVAPILIEVVCLLTGNGTTFEVPTKGLLFGFTTVSGIVTTPDGAVTLSTIIWLLERVLGLRLAPLNSTVAPWQIRSHRL